MQTFFEDEFRLTGQETLSLQRMRASLLSAGGWIIGERFDNRYDTMVGGFHTIVTQSIDKNGQLKGGFDLNKFEQYPKERAQSYIVDYEEKGKHISVAEAEKLHELAPVLARLQERESAYEKHLAQRAE